MSAFVFYRSSNVGMDPTGDLAMSHFYGTLQGAKGKATRCGTKSSGITTYAASWEGAIRTTVTYNAETGKNEYCVDLVPWKGVGKTRELAKGTF